MRHGSTIKATVAVQTAKRPRGRPSVFTWRIAHMIGVEIRKGATNIEAATIVGISEATFYRWLEERRSPCPGRDCKADPDSLRPCGSRNFRELLTTAETAETGRLRQRLHSAVEGMVTERAGNITRRKTDRLQFALRMLDRRESKTERRVAAENAKLVATLQDLLPDLTSPEQIEKVRRLRDELEAMKE